MFSFLWVSGIVEISRTSKPTILDFGSTKLLKWFQDNCQLIISRHLRHRNLTNSQNCKNARREILEIGLTKFRRSWIWNQYPSKSMNSDFQGSVKPWEFAILNFCNFDLTLSLRKSPKPLTFRRPPHHQPASWGAGALKKRLAMNAVIQLMAFPADWSNLSAN